MVSPQLASGELLAIRGEVMGVPEYAQVVLEQFPGDPDRRVDVLDVGCGTGVGVGRLSELRPRWRYWGLDADELLVKYAGQRFPEVVFTQGDLLGENGLGRFDLVTCLGQVLSYLPERVGLGEAVAALAGFCRPGAVLIVDTLTGVPDSPQVTIERETARGPVTIETQHTFDQPGVLVTERTWSLGGRVNLEERQVRRVVHPEMLVWQLGQAGFVVVAQSGPGQGRITAVLCP